MTTQQDIIRIEQQEIQRAIADGWTVEPWKGRKPVVEGAGKPILLEIWNTVLNEHEFTSVFRNMNELRNFYNHPRFIPPDRIHFTGATVYD